MSETPNASFSQLLEHLLELRTRLVRAVIGIVIITALLLPFANDLYALLALPLVQSLADQNGQMIATGVASPFLTPFKLALITGIFLAMPIVLYQIWAFIAPGLYKTEKKLLLPLSVGSVVLFYTGGAFAYFVVFPLVFTFLVGIAPEGVQVATDITNYLDFSIKLFFAFGVAFQVPIATILLILTEVISAQDLAKKRPYVIVGAFVMGMLLTPPDVISQTLLAVPMWLLFETGVIIGNWLHRPKEAIVGSGVAKGLQDEEEPGDPFNENNADANEPQFNDAAFEDELDSPEADTRKSPTDDEKPIK